MLDLVVKASRALSSNDAETLEGLVLEARSKDLTLADNRTEVASAALVLEAQVAAAASHLALRSRVLRATDDYKVVPWGR